MESRQPRGGERRRFRDSVAGRLWAGRRHQEDSALGMAELRHIFTGGRIGAPENHLPHGDVDRRAASGRAVDAAGVRDRREPDPSALRSARRATQGRWLARRAQVNGALRQRAGSRLRQRLASSPRHASCDPIGGRPRHRSRPQRKAALRSGQHRRRPYRHHLGRDGERQLSRRICARTACPICSLAPDGSDLALALATLRRDFGLHSLLLEGGGRINGAFLKAGTDRRTRALSSAPPSTGCRAFPASSTTSARPNERPADGQSLRHFATETLDGGYVWLRYRVECAEVQIRAEAPPAGIPLWPARRELRFRAPASPIR